MGKRALGREGSRVLGWVKQDEGRGWIGRMEVFFLGCRVVIRAMFKGGEVGVVFKDESVCVVCWGVRPRFNVWVASGLFCGRLMVAFLEKSSQYQRSDASGLEVS